MERLNNQKKNKTKRNSKTCMTKKAASRIQSQADRTGRNQNFKARAQRSASKRRK